MTHPPTLPKPNEGRTIVGVLRSRSTFKRSIEMIRCATVLIAFLTVGLTVFAQDKKGPLADLPSKPGAHVEKITAMGDNEWLELGRG
jgi:hypothetical protein